MERQKAGILRRKCGFRNIGGGEEVAGEGQKQRNLADKRRSGHESVIGKDD